MKLERRMCKTWVHEDYVNGHRKIRELSRSFDTLAEAERFADGKTNAEIYISKGRYKVTYLKITEIE